MSTFSRIAAGSFRAGTVLAASLVTTSLCFAAASARAAPQAADVEEDFLEITLPRVFVNDSHWDQVLDRDGGERVTFGVEIAGPSPYVRNKGRTFLPASVTKLFTTGAALEQLGPEFRYATRLQWRRVMEADPGIVSPGTVSPGTVSDVALIGEGDPTWGMIEFKENLRTRVAEFAVTLKNAGVRRIQGPIRVEAADPRWSDLQYPSGWLPEDEVACYGAVAQSFNLDINCAFYEVRGTNAGRWLESSVPVPVRLNLRAGARTELSVRPLRTARGVSDSFVISGTWARGSAAQRFYLPIHRTNEWVATLFKAELARAGIVLEAGAARNPTPAASTGVLEHWESFSPKLSEIIRPLNKTSLNMLADALFKTLGARFGRPDASLLEGGREVIARYIEGIGSRAAEMRGVPVLEGFYSGELQFWDGSGISRKNTVTTTGIMALLTHLSLAPEFPMLWESLPIAGTDGTLEGRMRGTAAEGILRAKTGTLRGVYNLAGYVPRMDAAGNVVEFVPFVILGETNSENKAAARAAQDRLGAALVSAINGSSGRTRPVLP